MSETLKKPSSRKTLLSAVQPTNRLTLGNYLGAIKNWVNLQSEYDCLFFAVDLHSLTVRQNPKELKEQTYQVLATYIAAGIDANETTLFVQSHVPEHAELSWVLSCFAYMGELNRMTQFKDKSQKEKNVNAGLFTYPTLMAADILLYQTHLVPVGHDQKQHIEITRDLAMRVNRHFDSEIFRVPDHFIPKVGARIMSLTDPTSKMSKSDPDPNSAIYLSDSDAIIKKKLKKAVTDSGNEIQYSEEKLGVKNLLDIQATLLNQPVESLVKSYEGKQYGHLKVDTADIVVDAINPLRTETEKLMADRNYLDTILKRGAEKARSRAQLTLGALYEKLGFLPGRYKE